MTSPDGAGIPEKEDVGGWAGDYGPLSILGSLGQALVMRPLDRLLSGLLGTPAGSFDTVEELVQDLIPAIIRKVLLDLSGLLGGGGSAGGSDVAGQLVGKIPIIGDVVKVVQGITTGLSGALASAAAQVGLRWAQVDAHEEEITDHTAQIIQLTEALRASAVTQSWISLDVEDMVSFPRILLGLSDWTTGSAGAHTHGTTSATVSSTPSSHSHTATSAGSHSHEVYAGLGTIKPGKSSLGLVPIPVNRGASRPRRLKLITGGSWGLFGIDAWLLGLYVLNKNGSTNRADWTLDLVWGSTDRKGDLVKGATEYAFDMGTSLGELFPGQILFGAQLQIAPGILQDTRPIAALPQPGITQAATTLLDASFYRLANQSSLPSSIPFNSLTRDNTSLPWMAITTELIAA